MKKILLLSYSVFLLLASSLIFISCEDDIPIDTTPLLAEPAALSISTGMVGSVAVSGGQTPYSIQVGPDTTFCTATIATIGVLTVTPKAAGTTSITVQDASDPVRTVTIPVTISIGHGDINVAWTINSQAPNLLCPQVNSSQARITVDGYSPVLRTCGDGAYTLSDITAGNHTFTAELLDPSNNVLSTINQSIYVAANQNLMLPINFNAPLIIGSLHFAWTIDGQVASTGCSSANSTSVRLTVGNLSPMIEPCSNGQLTMNNIPSGTYTMVADLLDAGNTLLSQRVESITILTNQTANVNLDFITGPMVGSATINWTVNGGANCPTGGNISITANGPSAGNYNVSCSAGTYQIPNLGPGTYSFDLVLTDPAQPGQQATISAQNVNIIAYNDANISLDISCLFCGGTPTTGNAVIDVTCTGPACGLTGTLRFILKDCGVGTPAQSTGTYTGVTLSAGTPNSHTFSNALAGGRCVQVYLDVNNNGILDTGDAFMSQIEQNVVVLGGQTVTRTVQLDAVSP
ncbi:MAG: hypothetical protein HYZ34_05455 [Ignavibacteriae bacterium]|nr:hypothetical protein [Ignavibacteriota bacterium]